MRVHVYIIESIDLSSNLIEYVSEYDFVNFLNLKSTNLNNNRIKRINIISFKLESFKLANTSLNKFNLSSLGRIETIVDLDLSFNTIVFDSLNTLTNIRSIKLSKVKFEQNNSLVKFLNKNVIELDFSENIVSRIILVYLTI